MFPLFPTTHETDQARGNAELNRHVSLGSVGCSDRNHRFLGEFGMRELFTSRLPTLSQHVQHVLGVRAKKKMTNFDTRRSVAAMQHMQAFRYLTMGDLPCHSRGFPNFISSTKVKTPVPLVSCGPSPEKTSSVWFRCRLGEESFFECHGNFPRSPEPPNSGSRAQLLEDVGLRSDFSNVAEG